MSIFSIFVLLIIFVCFLLVLVIMVQNPKGGGLSSSFGGGGQQMGGVQKTTDFLDRSTWILSTLLLILILLSNSQYSIFKISFIIKNPPQDIGAYFATVYPIALFPTPVPASIITNFLSFAIKESRANSIACSWLSLVSG